DGLYPVSNLIIGKDGSFYGTTTDGGTNGQGTIFRFTRDSKLTTLHSFTGTDGAYPTTGLIQDSTGVLYGVTSTGGANGYGAIFSLTSRGTNFRLLHSFMTSD